MTFQLIHFPHLLFKPSSSPELKSNAYTFWLQDKMTSVEKYQLLRLFFKQKPNQSWGTTRLLNAHSVVTPLQDIFPTRLHSFVTFVNKVDTYLLLVNNTRLPTSFQQVSQSRVEFYSTNKLFNYNLQTQTRFLSPDLNMWLKSIIQDQCVMPMHT